MELNYWPGRLTRLLTVAAKNFSIPKNFAGICSDCSSIFVLPGPCSACHPASTAPAFVIAVRGRNGPGGVGLPRSGLGLVPRGSSPAGGNLRPGGRIRPDMACRPWFRLKGHDNREPRRVPHAQNGLSLIRRRQRRIVDVNDQGAG